MLETVLAERGVTLEKDARVDSVIRTDDGGVLVRTTDGREIRGSHALMTVGSVPNTDDLGLDIVGIETTPSGSVSVVGGQAERRPRWATVAAVACFALCSGAVLFGIYLIVPVFHSS